MSRVLQTEVCPICGQTSLKVNTNGLEKQNICTSCQYSRVIRKINKSDAIINLHFFNNQRKHEKVLKEVSSLQDVETVVSEFESYHGVRCVDATWTDPVTNETYQITSNLCEKPSKI